jgi:translocation and assembly module TamB
MYALAFKNIKSLPVIEMKFESKYHITGGFNLDELIIEGKIKGSELKIFEEEADFVNLDFSLNQQILKFENIEISKSRGQAKGNFYINLKNNHMELAGFGKGLKLSDFNHYQKTGLTYDGDLNLDFEGSGNSDKFPSRIKIKTTNAFIDNNIASGSTALIEFKNNDIITKLDLFGSKVKSDIIIGMESKQVSIKNSIDTNDIRELLGVFSAHNIIDKTISGKIKAKVQTDFNLVTNKLSKLLINISSFNLKKGDVDLRNVPGKNIISIQDGVVEKWDLRFVDGEDFFNSLGENLPNGAILLSQNFSIKASIFQLLSSYIDRANGKMKGNYQVSIGKEIKMNEFKLYAKNNSLKFKKMPGQITDLEYEVIKDKNNFIIKKILGKYGEGEFKIIGTILFDNFYPKINLDYKIERSTIPLFKRSSILISGLGNFAGIKPPYKLSGKFQILHGELLDDPSDYSGEKKVSLEEYKKYLPAKNKTDASNTIELNINFETASTPVLVKNNLAELYLKGAGQVFGSPADPEVNGRIDAIPTLSKFKFKGHDFIINQGYV